MVNIGAQIEKSKTKFTTVFSALLNAGQFVNKIKQTDKHTDIKVQRSADCMYLLGDVINVN